MSRELFVGPSGTGKTYLMFERIKEILKKHKKKAKFIVLSPTANDQPEYFNQIKKKIIFYSPRVDEEALHKTWTLIFKNRKKKKGKRAFITVIVDDAGHERELRYLTADSYWAKLVVTARQKGIKIMYTGQRISDITKVLRDNMDIVHIVGIDSLEDAKLVRKIWAGFQNQKAFIRVMRDILEKRWGYMTIVKVHETGEKRFFDQKQEFKFNEL